MYTYDDFFDEIIADLCSILDLRFYFDYRGEMWERGTYKNGEKFYMIYDGVNENNFVLVDEFTPDHVRFIVVRCEKEYHQEVRNSIEYWERITRKQYDYQYKREEDYIPLNVFDDPDSALNILLDRSDLKLDFLFEMCRKSE